MNLNYKVIPAFAVPLGVAKLDKDCCDPLKELETVTQSVTEDQRGLYDQLSKVPEVKIKILNVFTQYMNKVLGTPEQQYAITTSWITKNDDGSRMTRHRHYNSHYSSVFYFDEVTEEHPQLVLENPLEKSGFFIKPENNSAYSGNNYFAPLVEGLIIFFPSYIFHHHYPFTFNKVPRKSLACNYVPIGKIGDLDSTLDTSKLHG